MTGKEVANFKAIKALGIPYRRHHLWRLVRLASFQSLSSSDLTTIPHSCGGDEKYLSGLTRKPNSKTAPHGG